MTKSPDANIQCKGWDRAKTWRVQLATNHRLLQGQQVRYFKM